MKKILTLLVLATLTGCSTTKGTPSTNWLGKNVTVKSEIPENGTVTATREFEKGLNLNGSKELYPKSNYNPHTVLVQYEYNRNKSEQEYADDFYKEEIFMEIPAEAFKKEYKDTELEQVKLIYAKHCYCKGEAGYYKITEGTLNVNHSDKLTKVKLTFKAPVTSLIETIEFSVE